MITAESIIAALKANGPSSPTAIANAIKAEPSAVGYHLRAMLKAKALIAAGTSNDRVYGLPDQKLGRAPAPPQRGKKKARKPRAAAPKRVEPKAANGDFTPAITADCRLVLVDGDKPAQIFGAEHTEAIATLLLQHYKA